MGLDAASHYSGSIGYCRIRVHFDHQRGAQLPDASIRDADLSGANLQGADLQQTIVNAEQLEKAKSLEGAIMPDGSKHP